MVPAIHARRGRCLHRPETLRAGPGCIIVLPSHRTSGTMRASSPTRTVNLCHSSGQSLTYRCPLHTRPCGATLSKQERAGVSLIRQGLRPATFPGGEGCLRRGVLPSTCYVSFPLFLQGILPQAVTQLWKGAVGKGDIHKNTPQLFYKLWRNFLGFPGGSGGRAGERGGQFASFCFFSSYIQVYPQSFPGFPQNLSTAVDTAVDKFKSLFEITCSGRHRWLRHPSYRHPWPG